MLLSLSHRFLFVHVPKTGGFSIREALQPYASRPDRYLVNRMLDRVGIHVNHWGPPAMRRFRRHASARQAQHHLPRAAFDELYKFAFVRNPWDRMVSFYHYVLSRPDHHRHEQVKSLPDFEHYLRYEARRGKESQKDLLVDRHGNVLVDFVGRYESLQEDFAYLRAKLLVVCKLEHHNRSKHRDYRQYYNSRTVNLVAELFQEDIELFGYTFDATSQSPPATRIAA